MASRVCFFISALSPSPLAPSSAWLSSHAQRTPGLPSTSWAILEEIGYVSIKLEQTSWGQFLIDLFSSDLPESIVVARKWDSLIFRSVLSFCLWTHREKDQIHLNLCELSGWGAGFFRNLRVLLLEKGRLKWGVYCVLQIGRPKIRAILPCKIIQQTSIKTHLFIRSSVGTADPMVSNTDSLPPRNLHSRWGRQPMNTYANQKKSSDKYCEASSDKYCEEKKIG